MVDLTADDQSDDEAEMLHRPASPSPHVSDDEMETDKEEDLLASPGHGYSNDSTDSFEHV